MNSEDGKGVPSDEHGDVQQLVNELNRTIRRNRLENQLNLAEVVGALELVKSDLIQEVRDGGGDDGNGDAQ